MSTPVFLAWSVGAALVAALLFFLFDRMRRPERSEFGRIESISMVAMLAVFGAYTVAMTPTAPAWTRLLSVGPLLALGVVQLVNAQRDPASYPFQPGLSYFLIAIGTVRLAVDSYHYASGGTGSAL